MLDIAKTPPYGLINHRFHWDVITRPVPDNVMEGGVLMTAAKWKSWIEDLATEMADYLWPRYDTTTGEWAGAASKEAIALTQMDFALMRDLRKLLFEPCTLNKVPLGLPNLEAFEIEDERKPGPLFPSLERYLPTLDPVQIEAIRSAMSASLVSLGPTPLQFKAHFQRPRPYQVAFQLGMHTYEFENARSAVTPSLISGHALQGLISGTAAYMKRAPHLSNASIDGLEQFAVDFGDRRVLAGVHYPSDNIASWIVGLKLCRLIYGHDAAPLALRFMGNAIKRSVVYGAVFKEGGEVFKVPLEKLHEAMEIASLAS